MPPESLTPKQQELMDQMVRPGSFINERGILVGKGIYHRADARTVEALYRRRLIRKLKNKKWICTPAGRKVGSAKSAKLIPKESKEIIRGENGVGKRGPLPGHGGKPKGTVSNRTWHARDLMLKMERELGRSVDPIEGMMRVALILEEKEMYTEALDAWKALAPYLYPRLSNIEHLGAGGGPIQHSHKTDLRKLTQRELDELERLQMKATVEATVN